MTKILLADDDRVVLLTLAEGLRKAGYEVVEARDGVQALALCLSETPALALLDIRMPGLNGLELASRLRGETTVPFLIFSAYADEEFVRRAVEIGALGYLIKPLPVASIIPAIRAALARSKEINGLQDAVLSNRTIATAVGMLMCTDGIDQPTALSKLRQQARARRCKLENLARALVDKIG